MEKNLTSLAIIPARGGSKRIPKKNIRLFCGKPIISYVIEIAIKSKLFDKVMVSTDDLEIAKIAESYGAETPFMRSQETSNDHADILSVVKEVVDKYKERNITFDLVCCLLPTAPLINFIDLVLFKNLLVSCKYDATFPVVQYNPPVWRGFRIENGFNAKMVWPENYLKRTQDLEPVYHDAGQFYWMRPEQCFAKGRIFTDNIGCYVFFADTVQDIDTEEDWIICEEKYRKLHA